jgi:hypothetical protein
MQNFTSSFKFTGAFLLLLTLSSSSALGFAELVRHGYPNCIACHVSPSGGGVLTEYGRALSKDLLSTWSYEGEERLGHKLIEALPSWLQIGGDQEFIQTYKNNPLATETKNFWMENELEAALRFGKFYVDANVGLQRGPSSTPNLYDVISSRHYLGYYLTDEFSIRFGKFTPAYGLNLANHTLLSRGPLGFDQGMEHLNLEAAYFGEKYDVFLTALLGKADIEGAAIESPPDPSLDERGLSFSSSRWILEKFKIGASFLYANSDVYKRSLFGIYEVLKLSEKFYFLGEVDWQSKVARDTGIEARGPVLVHQLGYEAFKGLNIYLLQQESYLDLNSARTRDESYGSGVRFYPRPHFEFQVEYRKERNMRLFNDFYDYAFILGHYYF